MSTSTRHLGEARASLARYAVATVALATFGVVYERFSFGVYSPFMVFAFAVPLMLGALPSLVAWLRDWRLPKEGIRTLYGAGVALLAVGSIMHGVLDIYGTTNAKLVVYPLAGAAAIAAAIIWALASADGGNAGEASSQASTQTTPTAASQGLSRMSGPPSPQLPLPDPTRAGGPCGKRRPPAP